MPELPDVAVFKRYLDAAGLHQRIRDVTVKDTDLLVGVGAAQLTQRLKGRQLEETRRHGKHLFVRTSADDWLRLHFGMTGYLKYFQGDGAKEPEHTRVLVHFPKRYRLAYVCQRKLGEVSLVSDPGEYIASLGLGPDPFRDGFTAADFRAALEDRRGMLKTALMDQEVLAGIGNVYSDEILFQARLHPRIRLSELDADDLNMLYRIMRRVLRKAIEARAQPEDFPRSWLIRALRAGKPCPRCGSEIERVSVGGRNARYCPDCQAGT